jgi:hypothetical protein
MCGLSPVQEKGEIRCEAPNTNINAFAGAYHVAGQVRTQSSICHGVCILIDMMFKGINSPSAPVY